MKEKVYVETSVIGAYFDKRSDVASAAQHFWTRKWWDGAKSRYEVVSSEAVLDELKHSDYPHSSDALELMSSIPVLSIDNEIRQVVKLYNKIGSCLKIRLGTLSIWR